MTPSEHHPAGAESATELLARRAQLQEWLGRLGEVGDDIPAQVARRVRNDYEQRLAAVVAELSAHSEALAADRERLDEKLLAAAERHDGATDALEEMRLRHRIGELSSEEWESRRPGLESELEAARAERSTTEQEISALEELLAQISAGAPAFGEATVEQGTPAVAEPAEPLAAAEEEAGEGAPNEFAQAADEWMPELPMLEESMGARPVDAGVAGDQAEPPAESQPSEYAPPQPDQGETEPPHVSAFEVEEQRTVDDDLVEITNFAAAAEALADEVDPAPADEDYAFLQELDRAIAATAPESSSEEEPEEVTRPQPGLKCPDCGYSNDPAAWYCGVCGVDLG